MIKNSFIMFTTKASDHMRIKVEGEDFTTITYHRDAGYSCLPFVATIL